jgi:hypothetical protein
MNKVYKTLSHINKSLNQNELYEKAKSKKALALDSINWHGDRFTYKQAGLIHTLYAPKTFEKILDAIAPPQYTLQIQNQFVELVGTAGLYGPTEQFPLADYVFSEMFSGSISFHSGYMVTEQELGQAALTGLGINPRNLKTLACEEALADIKELIFGRGYAGVGSDVFGLYNNPLLAPAVALPNGAGGTPQWSTKTGEEILADIQDAMDVFVTRVSNVELIRSIEVVCLLPLAAYNALARSQMQSITGIYQKTLSIVNQEYPNLRFITVPRDGLLKNGISPGVDMGVFMIKNVSAFDNVSTDDKDSAKAYRSVNVMLPEDTTHNGQKHVGRMMYTDYGVVVNRPWAIHRVSGI